mmetsp:Transcript_116742/g.326575  ORF Transcript_116742/g.326575 Transcript_116742/m.326575 type:complete len:146 (+) Transcript_116742:79-516(+)
MDPGAAFCAFAGKKRCLDLDDLSCAVIAVFGAKFKKEDLRCLMLQFSSNGEEMGEDAFRRLVEERRRLLGERDRAFRMFTALDAEGRGFLDLASFEEALAGACRPAAARACEIFHDMDHAKAGMVTVADFEAYLAGAGADVSRDQ